MDTTLDPLDPNARTPPGQKSHRKAKSTENLEKALGEFFASPTKPPSKK